MVPRGCIQTCVLRHLDFLAAAGAHDEGWDEHDPPGRDDFQVGLLHGQGLVIEVRECDDQAAVQALLLHPILDLADDFCRSVIRQQASLVDELAQDALAAVIVLQQPRRHLRHHSAQAAQDRCARARQCASRQSGDGVGLSSRPRLGPSCDSAHGRCKGPRLTGLTRAAAARPLRGTTTGPRRLGKHEPQTAPFGATDFRGSRPATTKIGLQVAPAIGSVRNAG